MDSGSRTFGLFLLGLCLGGAILGSAAIGADALLQVKRQNQSLEVKGFAERKLSSDWAVWNASFTTRAATLEAAYAKLEKHRDAVLAFLAESKVPEGEIELQPVSTQALYAQNARGGYTNEIEGYALSQRIQIASADIDRVSEVSQGASALVRQGIELTSPSPEYFYTRLGELKVEMLGEATRDARRRAEVLAVESGSALGPLRSARQGVFQITPVHSTEVSNYGRNDTSSREKAIKAVVTVSYGLES